MNNDDLIELLQAAASRLRSDVQIWKRGQVEIARTIDKAIAALSPVLPEDAQKFTDARYVCNHPIPAADLIERQQNRINELESELALASKNNNQQTT